MGARGLSGGADKPRYNRNYLLVPNALPFAMLSRLQRLLPPMFFLSKGPFESRASFRKVTFGMLFASACKPRFFCIYP